MIAGNWADILTKHLNTRQVQRAVLEEKLINRGTESEFDILKVACCSHNSSNWFIWANEL